MYNPIPRNLTRAVIDPLDFVAHTSDLSVSSAIYPNCMKAFNATTKNQNRIRYLVQLPMVRYIITVKINEKT